LHQHRRVEAGGGQAAVASITAVAGEGWAMNVRCTIDEAIADNSLLGAALGDVRPWQTWRTILRAAFGLKLNRVEARRFAAVAGDRKAPSKRVRELWAVAGRRGGKSRMAAAVACYIAAFEDHRSKLAPGEVGYVLVLAPSKAQARVIRDYVEGFFAASPILAQLVEGAATEEIRLKSGIVIAVHTNSFRTVRGRTLLACVFEETAFWQDETSALPDIETYRAVLPSLASTGGMLVGISSPYRKIGLLHTKHRDHFGVDDDDVLVIQAPTEALNPTISKRIFEAAREADPEAASAEWDAQFRADIASLLDDAVIDAAIDRDRPLDLPPRRQFTYFVFTDASAGRHDHFTLCIGHREEDRFVVDVIRGAQPPFDPAAVAREYAELARAYWCRSVTGDNYAGEWVAQAFRHTGMSYQRAKAPKSALYLEAVPQFMRGLVSIPDHARLIRELRLLERRTSRSGRDSVDHPSGAGGSDDYANSLVGCLSLAERATRGPTTRIGFIEGPGGGRIRWCDEEPSRPRVKFVTLSEKEHLRLRGAL
jgi:hypothetical protein